MAQDLSHYGSAYFGRPAPEYWFAPRGLPRPDQLAAVCYAFSIPFFGSEPWAADPGRDPGPVMSIGAGQGWLEQHMETMGCSVTGVDPSPGVRDLYLGSRLQPDWSGIGEHRTIMFVESLEHIPLNEILQIWQAVRNDCQSGTRVITVNWPDFFPIPVTADGWDHITYVNDGLFDELSQGFSVCWRRGSHLVLDKALRARGPG